MVDKNAKYFKKGLINGIPTRAYIDPGSSCTNISKSELEKLGLQMDTSKTVLIQGYGNSVISSLGTLQCKIKIDDVECDVSVNVVPDSVQEVPLLIGRSFTEQPHVKFVKDYTTLKFMCQLPEANTSKDINKIGLCASKQVVIPPNYLYNIPVTTKSQFEGDLFVDASLRLKENQECCIPRVVLSVFDNISEPVLPVINLSDQDIVIRKGDLIARAWPCSRANFPQEKVFKINEKNMPELPLDKINHGPLSDTERNQLIKLIQEHRDCFSEGYGDLGCLASGDDEMVIRLKEERPFTYRPYRMSPNEKDTVKVILGELLQNDIIRESQSNYCSPLILVKKKRRY